MGGGVEHAGYDVGLQERVGAGEVTLWDGRILEIIKDTGTLYIHTRYIHTELVRASIPP